VYRLAEMLEARRGAFAGASEDREIDAAIDLLVSLAGWSDKYGQVFGASNQVAGPYHNFTVPGPVGVVGVVCPDAPALLGLIGTVVPAVVCGCAVVAVVSRTAPGVVEFGEVVATGDVPAGVINLLTGDLDELAPRLASHRGISAVVAAGVGSETRTVLERGAAENMKRVHVFDVPAQPAGWADASHLERVLEFKTIWHPSSA
jgi:acyl-CoA reductase-like NAD-dependent aldehyde dehydrogenase